jgi:hypothetical protein
MNIVDLVKEGKTYCKKLKKVINIEDCELEKERNEEDNNQEANKE